MKILTLHCDYIRFKPGKKAIREPEELTEEQKKEKKIEECLVVFTAVEKGDSLESSKLLVENIKDIANQVKAKNIVLYPYAHLSSNLSAPETAEQILKDAESLLKKDKSFSVTRAPFGYYKEFELKCKGHPLAELSREIKAEGKEGKPETKEIVITDEMRLRLLHEISKTRLDREKLKENDHRIIGQNLDLFSFSDVAPGMVFWHNNGLIIFNELIQYWREEHRKAGYQEISTPQIMDERLWKISGHAEKYKDQMFMTNYKGRNFAVKPMNCPGGVLVYKSRPRSYKELPLRMAELGVVHRLELGGVLGGLFRVTRITQDDAHIYCTEKQAENEVIGIIDLINLFYKRLNLEIDHVELSTRPEKRIGSDETWDKAEKLLESVLKKKKMKYKINKGDGAFYGPKIDFHLKDSLGRMWQTSTIQLDFSMPERFDLTYTGEDNKESRPVMIHRTLYGSVERFVGILLEHLNGALPVWLSPIQVRVLSFTDRNTKAVEKLVENLKEQDIRVDADIRDHTVDYKIREAEMQKINYIIVLGDKEEKSKTLAVRIRGEKPKFGVKEEDFISEIKEKIQKRA